MHLQQLLAGMTLACGSLVEARSQFGAPCRVVLPRTPSRVFSKIDPLFRRQFIHCFLQIGEAHGSKIGLRNRLGKFDFRHA